MGAYLSEPVTDKISSDDDGDRLRYGASSMQGWRVSQEDAHNCIINFDADASLFAVYDGHGGHEVAAYTSQKLPDFIKETEAYKKGDYKTALIDAFLGFDATIAARDVVAILKEIAGSKENEAGQVDGSSEDEENVTNLYEEASMPIEQVIEKYQAGLVNQNLKKLQGEKLPNSPYLRARKGDTDASCSSSAGTSSSSSSKCADTSTDVNVVSSTNSDVVDSEPVISKPKENHIEENKECKPIVELTTEGKQYKIEIAKTEVAEECKKEIPTTTEDNNLSSPDSSNNVTASSKVEPSEKKELVKIEVNGDTFVTSKNENECSSTTTQENGEVKPSPKGKGKAIIKKSPEGATRLKSLRIRSATQLYSKLLEFEEEEEESDSEDENDETFEGAVSNSSSDAEDAADSSEGADDEGEEEDLEEEEDLLEDDEEVEEFTRNITEEPGSDSGCTAVVALVHGNELYVANAGDSRCIICRNGQAIEMSFDHKPEDTLEMERVLKAGGKVTQDGRVNGGLNLSRAIGDHAYKQNKELSDREQMITALPDIKTLTLSPAEDEFMVLACDGIWNFMSSQEVVEFVRSRLNEKKEKLSQICEAMFDHCLAPNTVGDGTGCDNMTAIVVQFNPLRGEKRCASPTEPVESTNDTKRMKTDENVV